MKTILAISIAANFLLLFAAIQYYRNLKIYFARGIQDKELIRRLKYAVNLNARINTARNENRRDLP